MADDAFARKLAELGRQFRAELPGRIADLERLAAAGPGELPALRAIAHRLAGQGGTFGAPEVSAAASAVEDADPADLPAAIARLAAVARQAS